MKRIDDRKQEEPIEKELGLTSGKFLEKEFSLNVNIFYGSRINSKSFLF